jgi:hypothetical protein
VLVQLQLGINTGWKKRKYIHEGPETRKKKEITHVWSFRGVLALNNIPQHIDGGIGLNRDTSLHTLLVDIADQLLGTGASGRLFICRIGRRDGGNRSLVVEAVEIATGLLKLHDPFMRL